MLRSLEIRNYRNLRHLTIEKLGRVNLLVGKNNTGKTSVLEAVYLWANRGRYELVYNILRLRGGLFDSSDDRYQYNKNSLSSLFLDQKIKPTDEGDIIINGTELRMGFEIMNVSDPEAPELLFFKIEHTDFKRPVNVLIHQPINPADPSFPPFEWPKNIRNQFVNANGFSSVENGELYDNVVTTDAEDYIIKALKIVNQDVTRIAFRTDSLTKKRYAVVRLNDNYPQPLQSMGDGINRILTIILAMVNCENGYLFIDEFENGLHYSVQEKLWEVIFYLAERLNIQVFATTHSNDAIRSFTSVLAKQEKPDEAGKAIRLQLHNGDVRAIDYSPEELETAVEYNIEVR
mgnify:FL=1